MAFKIPQFQLICFALVLAFGLWATSTLARPLDHPNLSLRERHELWMARHGRVYKDLVEKEKRFNIFKKNVERIEKFNHNTSSTKSFKLGINAFTDLTREEFIATHTGYKRQLHSKSMSAISTNNMTNKLRYNQVKDMPQTQSVDWREKGAVTGVKDQKTCGSCSAFAVVAAVEGLNFIMSGQLVPLSEQQLLDCIPGNDNCKGIFPQDAFDYVQNQGLVTEDAYPYLGQQEQCQVSSGTVVRINGNQKVPQNDEGALMQAVYNQPVSVVIDGGAYEFMNYQGGVFDGDYATDNFNHAVTVIGYGTSDDGKDYWLLKNSWGESWGENGFMRMIRNQNKCGISMEASYPV